jgi:hypothetical protein
MTTEPRRPYSFFRLFSSLTEELIKAQKNIPFKEAAQDFIAVAGSANSLFLLNLLAVVTFIFLPQGKDVLWIVSEKVGTGSILSGIFQTDLLFLLAGLVIWSIISEFASRYAIFVTDNSGRTLTEERVLFRKLIQNFISAVFLFLPFTIVVSGLLNNYFFYKILPCFQTGHFSDMQYRGLIIPLTWVISLMILIKWLYYGSKSFNNTFVLKFLHRLKMAARNKAGISDPERNWSERLYGIYNNFHYILRKQDGITGKLQTEYASLINKFENFSETEKKEFPRSVRAEDGSPKIPDSFELISFHEDKNPEGNFRWIYRIPNKFYTNLHRQVIRVGFSSLFILLLISILPVGVYSQIGSPALLMLAFACWTGIYILVLFIDFAILRPGISDNKIQKILKSIPLRQSFIILLLVSSFINHDHPVRVIAREITGEQDTSKTKEDKRPLLADHFSNWVNNYIKDSTNAYSDASKAYPVMFVCAEGGALRTGAYSSMMLSLIQDSLAQKGINFRKSVYAYSGVSGGSLGIGFFNSLGYLNNKTRTDSGCIHLTRKFFETDFLAPVIGKMLYGDILNLYIPWHIPVFDRAIALEEAWEEGFDKLIAGNNSSGKNYFRENFRSIYTKENNYPALFINTSEVETGIQCWVSNVQTDIPALNHRERDLLKSSMNEGIKYSTAINFSTRFPLFSPAATVFYTNTEKFHYVDGGYVENTGSATMYEILNSLRPVMDSLASVNIRIKPYVLVLNFSEEENSAHANLNMANEVTEILNGIYNTRGGRTGLAIATLKNFTEKEMKGKFIQIGLNVSSKRAPMNWILSGSSLDNIEKYVADTWKNKNNNKLKDLYMCDKKCRRLKEN